MSEFDKWWNKSIDKTFKRNKPFAKCIWEAALEWLNHKIYTIDYVGYQEIGKIIEKELREIENEQ